MMTLILSISFRLFRHRVNSQLALLSHEVGEQLIKCRRDQVYEAINIFVAKGSSSI